ncbi:MAG: AmmeMemoRadiSam system radical SAM enzyme [Candidatus Micrarchaeota archaeon]|nr:AmmeMemoRadiSam system radical SAM enzyme [Candidatus Micrarchaeota archaeon]
MKEAYLYKKLGNVEVKCLLCAHGCIIRNGARGFCGVRENRNGILYSLVYGKLCSQAVDPIEKKPFYHFRPGSLAFSIATVGCNFRCLHCQNASISQPREIVGEDVTPERIAEMALASNCDGIAYTYTEPTIFFEYAVDTAKIARKKGLYNVFVTNGYMTEDAIKKMGDIDASRIDLKSMSDKFYREICSARLEPVLKSIKLLHSRQHVEIINLVIPTKNDSDEDIRALCKWVFDLDKSIPLHFTAYYPSNKMAIPGTPASTLEKAYCIAKEEGIEYPYVGNVPGHPGENTYCPKCNEQVIERSGFSVSRMNLAKGNKCPNCGAEIKIA